MNTESFVEYSAGDSMKIIRSAINNGKAVEKKTKEILTKQEALVDVEYFNFIMQQGYSGFSYYDKSQFHAAYSLLTDEIQQVPSEINVSELLDKISSAYNFILDGHLAITCGSYGVGFYKPKRTYVNDLVVYKEDSGCYTSSKGKITFDETRIRTFPTVNKGKACFLIGTRSYNALKEIEIFVDDQSKMLPVHRIDSELPSDKILAKVHKRENMIVIKSSTFTGDKKEDIERMYQIGRECRKYQHVIWDLSNNMGGNAVFAKEFVRGLNGKFNDEYACYQLQSNLVTAKESGEIKEVQYGLIPIREYESAEQKSEFENHLHIIINDSVASSAELALVFAQSVKNRTLYGSNTLGIGQYGDLMVYYLPHSKSIVWCPHKVFLNGIEESIGVEPDCWMDGKDVSSRVIEEITCR